MPIIIPDNHAQVTFLYRGANLASEDTVVTVGLRRNTSGVGATASIDEIIDRWNSVWGVFHADSGVDAWVYEGLTAKYRAGGVLFDIARTANVPGGSTTVPLPPNTAMLVRKTSDLAGRKNKGRMYLPGVLTQSGVNAGGTIVPAILAANQTRLNTLYTAMHTFPIPGQPAERRAEVMILHSDATAPTVVTGFQAQGVVATQRRRLR